MTPPPEARWAAYADGTGHAFLRGPAGHRALCEVVRLEERWEHPIRERCVPCTERLNELTKAALLAPTATRRTPTLAETELRGQWGDR